MRVVCLSLLACLIVSTAYAAGPYDPEITWRTVFTPRFAVHYPEGGRNLAIRVGRLAEESLNDVSRLLGFTPEGPIDIVLSDASDRANGSAQVLPKNIIRLFLSAPTELTGLSSYDDWLRILLVHELTHICDIDQTGGFTRFLRAIFGKYIQWNGLAPQFLSEGIAVYAETVLTNTGRGRSSYVAMLLRMAALEDRFFEIDQAHIQVADWPGPNVAYFYGGFFHLWLAERFGRDAVRNLHQYNAAMPLPYLYWFGAESILGDSLPDLWEQWRADELEFALEVKAAVERQGVTPSRRITFHGRNITGARYHPSGKFIIYSRTSPVDGSTVRRVNRDGTDDHYLVLETFSPRFSFSPDGMSIFYSQNAINERFNDYNDLYRYNIESKESTRLRDVRHPDRSLRARDPDLAPDGQRLVFVQNRLYQSWISVATFTGENDEQLDVRVLVPPSGDTQHASPRFSPGGQWVALSTWFAGGRRDIVVVDSHSGMLIRRVTFDEALDGNPAWSPDGRYLLYESDADGISNIYAFDMQTASYFRVTRVIGGAFQADVSADGAWLLFRNASGKGFDIHEMPFDPESWEPCAYDPSEGYTKLAGTPGHDGTRTTGTGTQTTGTDTVTPLATGAARVAKEDGHSGSGTSHRSTDPPWTKLDWGAAQSRAAQPPLALGPGEIEEPYSPWRTLLPFQHNWNLLPALFFLNEDPSIRVATLGRDTLAHHSYVLSAGTSWYAKRLNWSAFYANDIWYPTFTVGGGQLAPARFLKIGSTGERKLFVEQRSTAVASVTLPVKQRHLFSLSYTFDHRIPVTPGAEDVLALGDFARIELGYQYRFTRRFPYSVGDEHGSSIAVAGRWYGTPLGADFNELLVMLDGRLYINNPLFDNHVLALRGVAALALGPDFDETFFLGGVQGVSLFTVQTESDFPLRGFASSPYPYGRGLFATYAEYRFPLWHVERGLWTIPVYVERLHLAVFADAGNTFGSGKEEDVNDLASRAWHRLQRISVGSGAEIRLDLSLGWTFPLTVRAGAGLPVVIGGRPHGRDALTDVHFYLALGTAI